jgi:ABC-type polysaccharide/polyol phosphate export permease
VAPRRGLCSATTIERVSPLPVPWRRPRAQTVDVLLSLTESDLRARYGRGAWQLVKWLVDPFALVGVYLLLVTFILRRGGEAPGLSLACAVIPFQLVMMSIVNAMGAVYLRGSIISNMAFDRVLIPLSAALTEAVAFAASLTLLVLLMAIYRVQPTVSLLWLGPAIGMTIVFSVACAYAVSLIGVWFRDLRPFVISFVRAMFFLAPGLVALDEIHGSARTLVKLNPLSGLFESFRSAVLLGRRPSAWEFVAPAVWSIILLAVALPLYVRENTQFAKVVE